MRPLGFLIIGLLAFVAVLLLRRRFARSRPQPPERELTVVTGGRDDLYQHLSDAATGFAAAAASLDDDVATLRTAIEDLAARCDALAKRQRDTEAFGPQARAAIIRLLLALYGVVERVTPLARHGALEQVTPALDDATSLIDRSTAALGEIAVQADETALRHLEAELDVLRIRLDDQT